MIGQFMAALPKDNLAYPVLLTFGDSGRGSGFYLNDNQAVYVVTACHVLFKDRLELYPGSVILTSIASDFATKAVFELDCPRLLADGALKKHDRADVAVCKLATLTAGATGYTIMPLPGVIAKSKLPAGTNVMGVPTDHVRKIDDVLVSNDVFLFGYPTSLGRNAQIDPAMPLLRKGIIAGKTEDRKLIIDCPVYFGNSGGLVQEIHHVDQNTTYYYGIGVAVEMVPFVEELWSKQFKVQTGVRYENSGYSIVEPMDRVLELL
jgi:hypothetical protein